MATSRKKAPTISDVARLAGVSLPTVSRVLTGATPVREVTRDRVLRAMKDLGYRPNGAARALVHGRQPIIGVITRDTAEFGPSRMLAEIELRARKSGFVVAIAVLDPTDLESSPSGLDVLLAQPIQGLIVLGYDLYDSNILNINLSGIPVAAVSYEQGGTEGVPSIVVDDYLAAYETTAYLLDLGHSTVHHVAVPGMRGEVHQRERGWRDALQAAGAHVPAPVYGDWSIAAGRRAGLQLASDTQVSAVFCSNDELALGLMRSMHESGRRVPEDVSVAGLDDQPLAEVWTPSLTTFFLDWEWAGRCVFELLVPETHPTTRGATSGSRLIPRESTSPPR